MKPYSNIMTTTAFFSAVYLALLRTKLFCFVIIVFRQLEQCCWCINVIIILILIFSSVKQDTTELQDIEFMRERVFSQIIPDGKMVQLLIAGERGGGKSSYVNGLVTVVQPATETRIKSPAAVLDNDSAASVTEQVNLCLLFFCKAWLL